MVRDRRWQWSRRSWGQACVLGLALAFAPVPGHAADAVKVTVAGVEGDVRANVASYMGKLTTDDLRAWRANRPRLQSAAREAMEAMGFYDAEIKVEQHDGEVVVTVVPGEPVRVGRLHLVFEGEAGNDIAFTVLRESLPLKEGDVFHHGHYEALKGTIQSLAIERGYFDSSWREHEALVDPVARRVDVRLVYASGPRFAFGPVRFIGPDGREQTMVKAGILEQMVPFKEGEPFDAAKVLKLNQSLLDTRFFSEVRVRQQRDDLSVRQVPIMVSVAGNNPNDVDVGVGYSTDVEGRLSLAWRRPLINDRGHGIRASTELSAVRRSFDSTYTITWNHPIDDVVQLVYGVQREDVEDVVTYSTVVGVQRQIQRDQGWKRTASLRWNRESFDIPDGEEGKSDLVLPGFSLDRLRSKGGVDPFWGDRQYYQAELASSRFLSDADFVSLRAGFRLLRTYADNHQFILRLDGGGIMTTNFDEVPLTMRFFAGGDQSVRGYDYKSLSPRDENGVAIGGRYLATGSVEYDYTFYPRWRVALFTDGGNAFDSASEPLKVGSGIGIRWVSPVGPIRLDLAWAVSDPEQGLRVHFSMGPNL